LVTGASGWRIQESSIGGYGKGLGADPQPPKARGPTALRDFCNVLINITHFYTHFDQNSYFKTMTHQLKAFEKQSKRTKSK